MLPPDRQEDSQMNKTIDFGTTCDAILAKRMQYILVNNKKMKVILAKKIILILHFMALYVN